MWALLCLAIVDLRQRVARRPKNFEKLQSYAEARSLAFNGKGPKVEVDRDLDEQTPELYDYLNALRAIKGTADKAECPFVASPR